MGLHPKKYNGVSPLGKYLIPGVGTYFLANFAGAGVLLAHLKIKMRQQKLTLMFFSPPPLSSMGTFLHVTHRVSSREMTKIGLMILLAHLNFFAGAS